MSQRVDQPLAIEAFNETHTFAMLRNRGVTLQVVDGKPRGDGASITDRFLRLLQEAQAERRALLQVPAVTIIPLVVEDRHELHDQHGICSVVINDVEPRIDGALGRFDMQPDDVIDIFLIHRRAIDLRDRIGGVAARTPRNLARQPIPRMRAGVSELDGGQSVMRVKAVRKVPKVPDIAFIPDGGKGLRREIRLRMNRAELGTDGTPAAFGLYVTMTSLRTRPLPAGAGALRGLVEPVFHGLGSDGDRLEERVKFRVSGHGSGLLAGLGQFSSCDPESPQLSTSLTADCHASTGLNFQIMEPNPGLQGYFAERPIAGIADYTWRLSH